MDIYLPTPVICWGLFQRAFTPWPLWPGPNVSHASSCNWKQPLADSLRCFRWESSEQGTVSAETVWSRPRHWLLCMPHQATEAPILSASPKPQLAVWASGNHVWSGFAAIQVSSSEPKSKILGRRNTLSWKAIKHRSLPDLHQWKPMTFSSLIKFQIDNEIEK